MIYRIRICISGCTIARLHLATSSHILIMIYIVILIYIYLGVAITAGLAQASNCPWVLALESSSGAGFGSVTSCNHQGFSNTRDIYLDIYGIRYLYMVCIWFSMVLNYISKNGLCNRDNRLR